jgi:hypothetical protein
LGALPSDLLARIRRPLGRIDPRTDWPHGYVRFAVVVCLTVVAALGLVYFVRAVERLGDSASENSAANYDDREFGGGNALGVDKQALLQARGRIPDRGTYRLLVGPNAADLLNYVRYFLMPRRPDPDASWVLCYGCDPAILGSELDVVWENDAGITLGRLPG